MKETKQDVKKTERKQIKRCYELSACALLFGIAMIIIGVFL